MRAPYCAHLWEEARRISREFEQFEISHTLRGGNKEADRLANEAMDKGMGRAPAGNSAGQAGTESSRNPQPPREPKQILEGYVKNGVVHLLTGELPDGTFVKIIKE